MRHLPSPRGNGSSDGEGDEHGEAGAPGEGVAGGRRLHRVDSLRDIMEVTVRFFVWLYLIHVCIYVMSLHVFREKDC